MDTAFSLSLFHEGRSTDIYEYLGCNRIAADGGYVYSFRTYAPRAISVGLVSDFLGWEKSYPMHRVNDGDVWECTVKTVYSIEGDAYKFRIETKSGTIDKGDPYARYSRGGADGASLVYTSRNFPWEDGEWLAERKKTAETAQQSYYSAPMNIYEVHLGSFVRHEDNSYYTYRELADVLVPYLRYMGYTHIELMPVAEYPYDGSWGYQVCAFFAPTSRFGTPDDFRYFINELHKNGIGVIMDWVPAHFPKDGWGLADFDGGSLYEYSDPKKMESPSWGTRFFDLTRPEVRSFLISNALYYIREFHIDGLRVDAVASILYLDFDRKAGEWTPSENGDNKSVHGAEFIRALNSAVHSEFPDVLTVAEESTAYPGVTRAVESGGLGFNLKWNMGFANDFYDYLKTDPLYRRYKHSALNFPLTYAFSENYILPISHDEVVHGKLSFIGKIHGDISDKFRTARAALLLIMTYPGKKLLFMGSEYAQFREWDYDNSLEWFMLDYPSHKAFRDYVAALNRFYLSRPELWELDFEEGGFEWLLPDESEKNLVAYKRRARGKDELIILVNFSGISQTAEIPLSGRNLFSLFDTDGGAPLNAVIVEARTGGGYTAKITVAPHSGMILTNKNKIIKIKEN